MHPLPTQLAAQAIRKGLCQQHVTLRQINFCPHAQEKYHWWHRRILGQAWLTFLSFPRQLIRSSKPRSHSPLDPSLPTMTPTATIRYSTNRVRSAYITTLSSLYSKCLKRNSKVTVNDKPPKARLTFNAFTKTLGRPQAAVLPVNERPVLLSPISRRPDIEGHRRTQTCSSDIAGSRFCSGYSHPHVLVFRNLAMLELISRIPWTFQQSSVGPLQWMEL